MLDFTKLTAKIQALADLAPKFTADYAAFKTLVDNLRGQIDPDSQAKLDGLADQLGAPVDALQQLHDGVQPIV